jgi:formate/nitrite transporter FocA (FNT family)
VGKPQSMADEEDEVPMELDRTERREVIERRAGSARVVHEVIRRQGEAELKRGWRGLLASGLMAGVLISFSPIAQSLILSALPPVGWSALVAAMGYAIGFIIVILGNNQLFTESTVTAVLPIATKPTLAKTLALLRLWSIVFGANMLGTLAVAAFVAARGMLHAEHMQALLGLGRAMDARSFGELVVLGIPSGVLIGAVAWMQPNARGSEFWAIFVTTWTIAAAGFSHCVAGAFEAWSLWLAGDVGLLHAAGEMILPSLLGNIAGGSVLFAVLAHVQVQEDLV